MMPSQFTVKDLVEYVLTYRTGDSYRDYTWEDITAEVLDAGRVRGFAYATSHGRIIGVVTAFPNSELGILHIRNILVTEPHALQLFIEECHKRFPRFQLTAKRHGQVVVYNTDKLLRRLSHGRTTTTDSGTDVRHADIAG